MNCASQARKLADYITGLQGSFETSEPPDRFCYYHIGALYTDIVLQAGVRYNSVVKPRVQKVLTSYADHYTVNKFLLLINDEGLSNIINWKHHIKLNRFESLLDFSVNNRIDSCADLKLFLLHENHQQEFLAIKGFGPKTLDYLLKLLNVDSVAVDRHIYSFVKMADIEIKGYLQTKKVVEYAADFLNMSRTSIDKSIWQYMSEKNLLYQKTTINAHWSFLSTRKTKCSDYKKATNCFTVLL